MWMQAVKVPLMAAAILVGGLAAAQTATPPSPAPSPTSVAPVIVTATPKALPPTTSTVAVETYIRDHAAVSRTDRLARWREPICPITFGGPEADNDFVTARIKEVAAEVGARVDSSPKCASNVEVIFSAYPQQLINLIYKRHPLYVGYHHASEIKALTTFDRPIRSWYATATRAYSTGEPDQTSGGVGPGQRVLDESWAQSPSGDSSSRFDASITSEFANVLIIVDQKAVAGFTIGSIADYAAMAALSQPAKPDGCGALDSILDLLAHCPAQAKPEALTTSDKLFLKALYAANLDLNKSFADSSILRQMKQGPPK
jgi:hypothetical protein